MDKCLFRYECEIWAPSCSFEKLVGNCYPRFAKEVLTCKICDRNEVICCKINKSVWGCSECFGGVIFPRVAQRIGLDIDASQRILERILNRWAYLDGSTVLDFSPINPRT